MAATNHTTNYNLPQYIGTDKPTYLGDWNSTMGAIDTQMKTNADNASGALSAAQTAQTNANTALSTAQGADTKADTALTNAAAAQSTADTAQSVATSALSTANTANGKADTNANNITSLDTRVTSNEASISSIESAIDKNGITVDLSANATVNNSIIPFNNVRTQIGNKLTLQNNKIVIGSGINYIKVECTISLDYNAPIGEYQFYIRKNGIEEFRDDIDKTENKTGFEGMFSGVLLEVEENDVIDILSAKNTNHIIRSSNETYLTVIAI